MTRHERCVAVMGATATGKSRLGIELAQEFDGEIVSMDSRQVYRGMDIGTGKVSTQELALVPHHLIDILDPSETGSAGRHAELAEAAVADIRSRGRLPILVGGTGLYFRAYFEGLVEVRIPGDELARIRETFEGRTTDSLFAELEHVDPERAAALAPADRMRITRALEVQAYTGTPMSRHLSEQPPGRGGDVLKFVLTMPRPTLRATIEARTRSLFDAGWPQEVRRLLDAGVSIRCPGMNSLGYVDIAEALASGQDPAAVLDRVITRTQQYAKRQETFFRKEPGARRVDVSEPDAAQRVRAGVSAYLAA